MKKLSGNKGLMGLVLTRRLDEKLVIENGRIIITVVYIKKSQVKIHIECDKSIKVDRAEALNEKHSGLLP